jgi:hypothetical protein
MFLDEVRPVAELRSNTPATLARGETSISMNAPRVSAEVLTQLEQLLEDARVASVIVLAVVVLKSNGSNDLRLSGNATESENQMSVAGMLAALQKMVLELAD